MSNDDVNRRGHINTAQAAIQGKDVAERLYTLFHSDAKKHVEISGFKGIRKDGKHEFSRVLTVPSPLTIEHVQAHLDGRSGLLLFHCWKTTQRSLAVSTLIYITEAWIPI